MHKDFKTCQEWLLVEKVYEDGIFISNHQYIKMIKVFPINYELKTELEKEAILNSYQLFLKVCDFDLQILIQSKKENLDSYISQMKNQIMKEKNAQLISVLDFYIEYIQSKNQFQNSSSKNFYILIHSQIENKTNEFQMKAIREDLNYQYLKIKDTLSRCGNVIHDINNKREVEKILYSFYNFRKSLKFF